MLEYSKLILSKVSFDRQLFEKELTKAKLHLAPVEWSEFKSWCFATFGGSGYRQILNRHFNSLG